MQAVQQTDRAQRNALQNRRLAFMPARDREMLRPESLPRDTNNSLAKRSNRGESGPCCQRSSGSVSCPSFAPINAPPMAPQGPANAPTAAPRIPPLPLPRTSWLQSGGSGRAALSACHASPGLCECSWPISRGCSRCRRVKVIPMIRAAFCARTRMLHVPRPSFAVLAVVLKRELLAQMWQYPDVRS